MTWVKRNLFFLIGTVVALALIGLGGYYLWTQMNSESSLTEEIKKEYSDLNDLLTKKPQPGKAGATNDNVEAAKVQAAKVRGLVDKIKGHFQPIPPATGPGGRFANQLDETIVQLHRSAEQAGVFVTPKYYFTFQAQKNVLSIQPANVPPLAMHLGHIKAICEILFAARINQLNYIQREITSPNIDTNAPDYLPSDIKTIKTPLAEMTPYAVSFDCFSGELAAVLDGLADSPHSFVVKTIDVEPASATGGAAAVAVSPPQGQPPGMQPGQPQSLWLPPTLPGGPPAGGPPPGMPPQRFGAAGAPAGPVAPRAGSKPVTLVNENRLRVSLLIEVVKITKK